MQLLLRDILTTTHVWGSLNCLQKLGRVAVGRTGITGAYEYVLWARTRMGSGVVVVLGQGSRGTNHYITLFASRAGQGSFSTSQYELRVQ